MANEYPLGQLHSYVPGILTHVCEQSFIDSEHSSKEKGKIDFDNLTEGLKANLYQYMCVGRRLTDNLFRRHMHMTHVN